MKAASLTFVVFGLLAGLMATLTAIDISPAFLNASSGFSGTLLTTVFWVCLSGLLMLAAIALGIITNKD